MNYLIKVLRFIFEFFVFSIIMIPSILLLFAIGILLGSIMTIDGVNSAHSIIYLIGVLNIGKVLMKLAESITDKILNRFLSNFLEENRL